MKTAMQELIDRLMALKLELNNNPNADIFEINITELLDKEKKQIIDAWDNSTAATATDDTGLEYYNLTYKN